MTASAQAGMPLRALQDRLGEAGQWLALDPPTEPDGATVGGLLATGESGPRRLRYGALRDLVIGVTLVLPDGTVAHAGGHVIKNVAGYDLSKLMYGSLGTLGLIAEVVLRLHPLPETSATVVVPSSVQEATARSLALLAGAAGTRRRRLGRRPPRRRIRRAGWPCGSRAPPPAWRRRRRRCGSDWTGRRRRRWPTPMRPRSGGSTPAPTGPSRAKARRSPARCPAG